MLLFLRLSLSAFIPTLLVPFLSVPLTWLLPTKIMHGKYYSPTSYSSIAPPPTSHFLFCPLSCCPQLKPTPHRNLSALPTLCVQFPWNYGGHIYVLAKGAHFLLAAVKSCPSPLGVKPKASACVLQRTSVKAWVDVQRWQFPHLSPWPPHHSPPTPKPLGIREDKDWTSPDATLHKCLIAGKTLASVIKAVI